MPKSKRPKKSLAKKRTQYGAPVHPRRTVSKRALWVGLAAVVIVSGLVYLYWNQPDTTALTSTTSSGLQIIDEAVGNGAEAKSGMKASVHYTGWLKDGTKFDSSVDRGTPFEFTLGAGRVIKGWDQGVAGMKVGGKRKLIIPSALAYGAQGKGSIPPNSELTFDIQLLGLK